MPSGEILSLDARSCKPLQQIFRGYVAGIRAGQSASVYALIPVTARRETRRFSPPDIHVSLIAQLVCSRRAWSERKRRRASEQERERERERERGEREGEGGGGGYALFITAVMSWVTCGGNCPRRSSTVFCRESRMPRSTPLSRSARTTSIFPQSAASCIAVPADVLVFTSTPAASNTSTTALKPTYLYFPFFFPLPPSLLFFFSDWIMARCFSFFFLLFL